MRRLCIRDDTPVCQGRSQKENEMHLLLAEPLSAFEKKTYRLLTIYFKTRFTVTEHGVAIHSLRRMFFVELLPAGQKDAFGINYRFKRAFLHVGINTTPWSVTVDRKTKLKCIYF